MFSCFCQYYFLHFHAYYFVLTVSFILYIRACFSSTPNIFLISFPFFSLTAFCFLWITIPKNVNNNYLSFFPRIFKCFDGSLECKTWICVGAEEDSLLVTNCFPTVPTIHLSRYTLLSFFFKLKKEEAIK